MNNFLTKVKEYLTFLRGSYSQEGEDIVLARYFKNRKKGFFVDVGAHHPTRFSNTYSFYKKGWTGINIDATPGSMTLFKKYRPRDINVETPVSNNHKELNYYIFDEPALNSFSAKLSKERAKTTKYKIKEIIKLKPRKLSEILDKYLPKKRIIDFMSVDVEGFEYEVLTSNNWGEYKPTYLLIEILETKKEDIEKTKVYLYLKAKNYHIVGKTGRTIIFKRKL